MGLGLAPATLWIVVFLWALFRRRGWFRRLNVWAGSLAALALVLGTMAFFEASRGSLAWFTLNGHVSLGGQAGQAIVGGDQWLGVLRLVGIFVAGVAISAPALAADVGIALGRSLVYTYVFIVVAAKSILSMYHVDRNARTRTASAPGVGETPNLGTTPRISTSYATSRIGYAPRHRVAEFNLPSPKTHLADHLATRDAQLDFKKIAPEIFEEAAEQGVVSVAARPETVGDEVRDDRPTTRKFNRFWTSPEPATPDDIFTRRPAYTDQIDPTPTTTSAKWARPSTGLLLDVAEGGISEKEMRTTAETIRNTFAEYNVEVEMGQIRPGPTVTMYGLIPGWVRRSKQVKETDEKGRPRLDKLGKPVVTQVESKTRVKVDSILSREKDLALALKTPSIRIETPVMGKSQVGIEVPNPNPSLVTLRSVMASTEFARLQAGAQLPIALGKGSGGEAIVTDLARMPHLLIAGATGSGKSACINSIVSCLLIEKSPAEMRLLLIDPKRVELTPYNGVPHLITPVVVEIDQVVGFLKGMIREMLDRYRRMEEVGVRNIEAYNEKMPDQMPLLVVGIDELADLMMSAAFDVEQSLCRLAQLGRATGIHLIVATQRPSVDVVTGLIKANFPSRISFGVASHVDSRTILDAVGADKLLGRGDMLYLPLDASRPVRAQGVFISDREVETLVRFWQTTPRAPLEQIHLRAVQSDQAAEDEDTSIEESQDELLEKAIELGKSYSKLSTSLLQRRLRIGYPRAARLMDLLEEQGFVGPIDGSKSRDVIIDNL